MASSQNTLDLSRAVKYNADRSVDVEATLARVKSACETHNLSRENDLDKIAAVVDAVFADHPGATMSMDALTGFVLRQLNATPTSWGMLSKRTQDYVRSFENSKFSIKVGRGVSRIPPTT